MSRYYVVHSNCHEGPYVESFEHEKDCLNWVNDFSEKTFNDSGSCIHWIFKGSLKEVEPMEVKTKYKFKRSD